MAGTAAQEVVASAAKESIVACSPGDRVRAWCPHEPLALCRADDRPSGRRPRKNERERSDQPESAHARNLDVDSLVRVGSVRSWAVGS